MGEIISELSDVFGPKACEALDYVLGSLYSEAALYETLPPKDVAAYLKLALGDGMDFKQAEQSYLRTYRRVHQHVEHYLRTSTGWPSVQELAHEAQIGYYMRTWRDLVLIIAP